MKEIDRSHGEHFRGANFEDSWIWQMQNAASSLEEVSRHVQLSDSEVKAFKMGQSLFKIRLTPYVLGLIEDDPEGPLRRMLIPRKEELEPGEFSHLDPLAEIKNQVVPRLIHRYSDRALLLVTDTCSVYCRFCTRKHFTASDQHRVSSIQLDKALAYIQDHKGRVCA